MTQRNTRAGYTVLVEHATRLQTRLDGMKAALTAIQNGVDHPEGVERAPDFYRALEWAQKIAYDALEEFGA